MPLSQQPSWKFFQDSRARWGATGGAGSRGTRWSRVAWNVDRPRTAIVPHVERAARFGRIDATKARGSRGGSLARVPRATIDPGWRRGGDQGGGVTVPV